MGRTPRIKKEPFRKDSKNQDIKKNPQGSYGILVGFFFRRGKRASFKASAAGYSVPRRLRGRRRRLCTTKCLTPDFITSKHKKKNPQGYYGILVGFFFRRGKRASFKASAAGTCSFYFCPFVKGLNAMSL